MIQKYRAWDIMNKEMFKDTFAITESGQVVVVEQDSIASPPDYIFVDHLVIMQSTGLKDKNGKEIFEGDILGIETDTGIVYVNVYWDSKHALFMIKSEEHSGEEALAEIFEDYTYPFMVVGNVLEESNNG